MGIKVSDIYGSAFLNADDVVAEPKTCEIMAVRTHTFSEGNGVVRDKIVLHLDGFEKEYACGPQYADMISDWWGNDTDKWLGKKITLHLGKKPFGNRMVDAIVITKPEDF